MCHTDHNEPPIMLLYHLVSNCSEHSSYMSHDCCNHIFLDKFQWTEVGATCLTISTIDEVTDTIAVEVTRNNSYESVVLISSTIII